MTNQQKSNVAGKLCYSGILKYVNDIRAAAYPQTPEQHGGAAYLHFVKILELVDELERSHGD